MFYSVIFGNPSLVGIEINTACSAQLALVPAVNRQVLGLGSVGLLPAACVALLSYVSLGLLGSSLGSASLVKHQNTQNTRKRTSAFKPSRFLKAALCFP
jgi:hypothetical protein